MDAMYVYLIASSGFFLFAWVVLLLVAYALAFQGGVRLERLFRFQTAGLPMLEAVLIESHLLETHVAQEPATPVSLPEEVPQQLSSSGRSACSATTASGSYFRWSSGERSMI